MSVAVDSDAEDDAVSEIAEAAGVSPAPAKPSMSAPRRMLLFGLVVVVALAVLLCCWGFRVQRARHAQDQRGHFLQAARQCALNLTTIDWRNAEADVRRILDGATGEFYNLVGEGHSQQRRDEKRSQHPPSDGRGNGVGDTDIDADPAPKCGRCVGVGGTVCSDVPCRRREDDRHDTRENAS